jgi:hypothetical protein
MSMSGRKLRELLTAGVEEKRYKSKPLAHNRRLYWRDGPSSL